MFDGRGEDCGDGEESGEEGREREGKKTEGGSEGVYVSSLWWVRDEVTTGPENMRGVEVGWARNGR